MNVGVIWWRSTSNDRLNQKPNSTTDKMSLGLIACQPSVSRVSAECQPNVSRVSAECQPNVSRLTQIGRVLFAT